MCHTLCGYIFHIYICISYLIILYIKWCGYISYGQNLAHGKGTSLCRVGPLDKPSSGYCFEYRFRMGPYRFCSDGHPTTLSILLWSYLILSDTHMFYVIYHMYWNSSLPICLSVSGHMHVGICDVGITLPSTRHTASILQEKRELWLVQYCSYV